MPAAHAIPPGRRDRRQHVRRMREGGARLLASSILERKSENMVLAEGKQVRVQQLFEQQKATT